VEYGFLGISLYQNTNVISVSIISPSSPAEIAGLQLNDVIQQINDIPAYNYEDLLLYAGSSLAGTRIKLTVLKNGQSNNTKEIYLTLGKFHHTLPSVASVRREPVFGLRVDYLNYPQPQQGVPTRNNGTVIGVSVREVMPNSPAAAKFKAIGDNANQWIISHVNDTPISNPIEFYKATKGQTSIKLTLRDWETPNRHEITLP
jgi:S1-C subfamily serine protease